MLISSKSNLAIKEIIKLSSDRKYRYLSKRYVVEGIKPVSECIKAGCRVLEVYCTEELLCKFPQAVTLTRELFERVSSEKSPQGVLAVVELPKNKLTSPQSSCLLLDRLQDPGNLGTIIRTANAAGYREIYLINCTDAFSPKAVRASMSGIFFTDIKTGSAQEILPLLDGVPFICADMDGKNIFRFNPPQKFCLCIGNEGGGISSEIKSLAASTVSIPMEKSCESLNAAVSAGIAMYILKQDKMR